MAALPALAGNVLTVGGVGGSFADIQSAVAAAANDDVVLVRAGTYGGFTIDGKSLAVVADTGALVDVDTQIVVQDVAAGGRVVLAGLRVVGAGTGDSFLRLSNVDAPVRVVACEIGRAVVPGPNASIQDGARIIGCSDVALTGCLLQGKDSPAQTIGTYSWWGGTGVEIDASRVSLHDCVCVGGKGGAPYGDWTGGSGGGGCWVFDPASFLHASGSTFRGGAGAAGHDQQDCLDFSAGDGGAGGDGLMAGGHLQPPPQTVLLDPTCFGGAGGRGGTGACGSDGLDGPSGSPLALAGGAQLTVLPGSARRMRMPVPVRESAPLSMTFTGAPGDSVRLTVWDQGGFVFVPTYNGVLLERAPLLRRIHLGTVPGSGVLTATIAFPALPPGVQARTYFLQPYFVDATNAVRLGSAFAQVVLDSAF